MNTAQQNRIFSEELYRLPQPVIVLIPMAWNTLPEDQVILLGKILGSVRLSIPGVQILSRKELDLTDLKTFNPSLVLAFGTGLNPKSEPYTFTTVNGIRVIQSDALADLDDVKKKSLWNALKQAFA